MLLEFVIRVWGLGQSGRGVLSAGGPGSPSSGTNASSGVDRVHPRAQTWGLAGGRALGAQGFRGFRGLGFRALGVRGLGV